MNSEELTARVVTWRDSGLSWGQIATKTGLSRFACQQRYARAHGETTAGLRARIAELELLLGAAHERIQTQEELLREILDSEMLCNCGPYFSDGEKMGQRIRDLVSPQLQSEETRD